MGIGFIIRNLGNYISCLRTIDKEGVRRATFADIDSILELDKEFYTEANQHPRELIVHYMVSFPEGFYVYQNDNKIVGYIMSSLWNRNRLYDDWSGIIKHDKDGDRLFIASWVSKINPLRTQVEAQLMDQIISFAKERTIWKITIAVDSKWQDMTSCLEATGFKYSSTLKWFESEEENNTYLPAKIYEYDLAPTSFDEQSVIQKFSKNLLQTYKEVSPDELLTTGVHCHYEEILEDVQQGENILEVAFGQGRFLMKAHDKGANCTGVDISQHYVDAFKSKLLKEGYSEIEVSQGDMTNLEFAEHSFDRLVAIYVLCHYTKEQIPIILRNLIRLIKPDGKINFEVMSSNSSVFDQSSEAIAFELTKGSHFTADELIELMQQLGAKKDSIKLSERSTQWSMNEEQDKKQLSWLVKAEF